ncbi:MAG TPA: hypothetical protein VN733_06745 [Solirubrobacterales bacterium]|nr:hypothetical protein [Solirubrobacterales bacterium]
MSEVTQKDGVRVTVNGKLAPAKLPRKGTAPVAVSFSGRIRPASSSTLPQLTRLTIAINSHGRLSTLGLPRCRLGHIDPSTTAEALAACRPSLVGDGRFSADVRLPEQSPFPSQGKVLAFNGRYQGRPAVFAHIYGTAPVPTSYVLPFLINHSRGTYGTVLEASLPRVTGEWGYVTGISMTLDRTFASGGKRRSYISAGCPAPGGFRGAVFPLAKTAFSFEGGLRISSVLTSSCTVAE